MKQLLITILLLPMFAAAQEYPKARYENDTLYTASGYKIFKGQTLDFAKGTAKEGKFRYVKVKNGFYSKTLAYSSVIVNEIKKVSFSVLGNGYIDFTGYLILKNDKREFIVIHMAFDRAIENSPVLPGELIVADEFRNKFKRNIEREIDTVEQLYDYKIISKSEYKEMIKKLLAQ